MTGFNGRAGRVSRGPLNAEVRWQKARHVQRILAILLMCAVSPVALASDPSPLLFVMVLQVALLVWPLLLPLLYLESQKNRLYSYFLFLVLTLGSLGIVGLPQLLFTNFAAWFSAEDFAYRWAVPLNITKHVIAFAFCVWYLPRFRRLLRGEQPSVI